MEFKIDISRKTNIVKPAFSHERKVPACHGSHLLPAMTVTLVAKTCQISYVVKKTLSIYIIYLSLLNFVEVV
jgi:hypothetical protein